MAESRAVWGIEIGQAGLKAIKLRYAEAAEQVIAVAFDFVPHPKILSQPDAIPEELIPEAMNTFLSRNDVAGDVVCISVPGQSALARFIQLPPVEASKIHEIVKYEARQQIPFDLEDVIWDYQNLGGGIEQGGYVLEAEVGLFAMKREQIQHHLQPFNDAHVEVDLVQVAPLALYNMVGYDHLGVRIDAEEGYEAGNEHTIVVDMGADNSTLLVTNGQKIWIRNVPIGGNHFTRALTKEMKLTFAKAEHLKCNATKSPDPRAVFQALRPVFNDYVSEIQRSIGYFSSVNREATIHRVLGVGNGFKLAGLQKFLQQNLQFPVERVESFKAVVGDQVLNDPTFKDNVLGFAVPYGLALQGLKITRIHTSLLPPEILTARKIRRKKPWAVATAATLLFGLAGSIAIGSMAYSSVSSGGWTDAEKAADEVAAVVQADQQALDAELQRSEDLDAKIGELVKPGEEQYQWAELYKAIYEALPKPQGDELDVQDLSLQHRMKITAITPVPEPDLKTWFDNRPDVVALTGGDKANPPSGPGYVIRIEGHHFHHNPEAGRNEQGTLYVRDFFLRNLQAWEVPNTTDQGQDTPVRDIGLTHAYILETDPERRVVLPDENATGDSRRNGGIPGFDNPRFDNPEFEDPAFDGRRVPRRRRPGEPVPEGEPVGEPAEEVRMTTFVVEAAWQPKLRSERLKFTAVRDLLQREGLDVPFERAAQEVDDRLQLTLTSEEFEAIKTEFQAAQPPADGDTTTNGSTSTGTDAAPAN